VVLADEEQQEKDRHIHPQQQPEPGSDCLPDQLQVQLAGQQLAAADPGRPGVVALAQPEDEEEGAGPGQGQLDGENEEGLAVEGVEHGGLTTEGKM
jgi:hypothetical protein